MDPSLGTEQYHKVKKDMYQRAKLAWNLLDESKRHRITDAVVLPTTADAVPNGFGGMSQRWGDDSFL